MEYREFGKTGLRLSVMGFGGATLGDSPAADQPLNGCF